MPAFSHGAITIKISRIVLERFAGLYSDVLILVTVELSLDLEIKSIYITGHINKLP